MPETLFPLNFRLAVAKAIVLFAWPKTTFGFGAYGRIGQEAHDGYHPYRLFL